MKKIIILLLTVTILNSCVRSLYPLAEIEKEMIFKKELLGKWKNAKENTEYIVDTLPNTKGKTYMVTLIDHNTDNKTFDASHFLMMLVNLKGKYFLDCTPDTSQTSYSNIGEQSRSLLLPVHIILKVYTIQKNYLTMSAIDNDVFSRLLKNKKIIIKHEDFIKDEILLTEKPATLQKKLLELEKFPSRKIV